MAATSIMGIGSKAFRIALVSLAMLVPATAEIPVEEALGIYENTIKEHRNLSPLWGLVALESGVLANVRFFANYGSTPRPAYPIHPSLVREQGDDYPQDAISGVIQYLFPSPDGLILVANARGKDPIGEIAIEQRNLRRTAEGAGGLQKIRLILDAIINYRRDLGADPALADRTFRDDVDRILAPAKGGSEFKGRDLRLAETLRKNFAGLIQEAIREEARDAGNRYPPDIVEVALLAYAWQTAEHVEELYQGLEGLLVRPEAPLTRFDETHYRAEVDAFALRMDATTGPHPSPEEFFLFTHGIKVFGRKGSGSYTMPDLLTYFQARHDGGKPYPDCGETSLRNFFTIILSRGGVIDPALLEHFLSPFTPGETKNELKSENKNLKRLEHFFTTFASPSQQKAETTRDEWDKVVADLNHPKDPLPIDYGEMTHNLRGTGIENMLNLIAHLLPDPVLNEPWSGDPSHRHQLAGRKLDHLCSLGSRKDFVLDWDVDGEKAVTASFVTVRFAINGIPAFKWGFTDRHFSLMAYDRKGDLGFTFRPKDFLLRAWLLRFEGSSPNGFLLRGFAHTVPFREPVSHVYALSLRTPEIALALVCSLFKSEPTHWPAGSRILAKAVVPDWINLQVLERVLVERPGLRSNPDFYPLPGVMKWPQASKDEFLRDAVRHSLGKLVAFLLDHGADPNGAGADEPLLCTAMNAADGKALLDQLLAHKPGIALNVANKLGRTPLTLAVVKGFGLQKLLDAGADPNFVAEFGAGQSSALAAVVVLNKIPEAKVLLIAGADPHLRLNVGGGLLSVYEVATQLKRTELLALFDSAGPGKGGKEEKKNEAPMLPH